MNITLKQLLALVGSLDDSPREGTPRGRFRRYLEENVGDVGQLRDFVQECLAVSGEQYCRALQDLVNHLGRFLGFEVTFGRYKGVQGAIGFDGLWKSTGDLHVIIETKTTDVFAMKTATLVGYVDDLISEGQLPNWDKALGLYVLGRPDPAIRQLENAIVAEKRIHQLRVISVESLLSLAEMMNEYDIAHEDIIAILRPSGPSVDPVVGLMARLVAETRIEQVTGEEKSKKLPPEMGEPRYWLTPVRSDEEQTAEQVIETLVGQHGVYAIGKRTPGRKDLAAGHWICFYASGKGVVAHARVTSAPEEKSHEGVRHPEKYRWLFGLDNTSLYLDTPIVVDPALRSQLEAFGGGGPNKAWGWFVQATRSLTEHDWKLLTRQHDGA